MSYKHKLAMSVALVATCALGTGCVARAGWGATVVAPAPVATVTFNEPPPLVQVEPDVYVVEDYPAPIYFHAGAYWYYEGGVWYERPHWDAPWIRADVRVVPTVIVHRDHHRYVHYRRPRPDVVVYREPHVYVRGRAVIRPEVDVRVRGRADVRVHGRDDRVRVRGEDRRPVRRLPPPRYRRHHR
jgi:hypothetical protein